MLYLEGSEDFEGITIYPDDVDPFTYYLLPQFPRMRQDKDGNVMFKLVRFRTALNRPGGFRAGGLLAIDVELAAPDEAQKKIVTRLEERVRQTHRIDKNKPVQIKLARPTFSKGTARLEILAGSDVMVQKVNFANKPSLVGNNVISGSAELSEMGVATLEAVMRGRGAGMVRVEYDLSFWTKLPSLTVDGHWEAKKFYDFAQTVDFEENFWSEDSYEENISETLSQSEAYEFTVNAGPGFDQKTIQAIQDSMRQSMDEMVKRNMLEAIPAADRDITKIRDQDIEDIKRTFRTHKTANVDLHYRANMAIEFNAAPNANLPSLASLTVAGKPLKLDDYFTEVDGDHPFFRTMNLVVQVNADFANLPIFSVEVSIDYPPHTAKHGVQTLTFGKPDDVGKFTAFMDGAGGKYKYSYTVNYKGEARTYQKKGIESEATALTINVDDLGIWVVDIEAGDINFDQVESAQVSVRYQDANVPLIERQFTLTKDQRKHQIRELIFEPLNKPYLVKAKYLMKGGLEVESEERQCSGQQLYVNDPFSTTRALSIIGKGDFEHRIDSIFLDLVYDDAEHRYRQTRSLVLSKAGKLFDNWVFPAFNDKAGKLSYSGQILFRGGSTAAIVETPVNGNTILVGEDVITLDVELVSDLIDWSQVKLAVIELSYSDPANNVAESKSFTFKQGANGSNRWAVPIKDRNRKSYSVLARYFMTDGSRKELKLPDALESTLVLEVPN